MAFELYRTATGSRGSLAEVWIDSDAGLCKKIYAADGTTIKGQAPLHSSKADITKLFGNEIYWSQKLRSKHVVKLLEFGEVPDRDGYYIIQEYHNPDMLHFYDKHTRLSHIIPDVTQQVIEMFELFRDSNVYKFNNAMCNLTFDGKQLKAFDFKYATERYPKDREYEWHSIMSWISKIDPKLPGLLEDLI